jgi:hypothetical protein
MDGVTHFCLVLSLCLASIHIGIDAQVAKFCREPLGAVLRGFGSQICGLGNLAFPLIVIAGQFQVVGKVKRYFTILRGRAVSPIGTPEWRIGLGFPGSGSLD